MKKTYYSNIMKKMSHQYEMIALIYHESGHAITALLNNIQLSSVIVKPTNLSGITHYSLAEYNVEDENLHKKILLSEISVFCGGLAAEKIYYKNITGSDIFPQVLKQGSWYDTSIISDIIKRNNLAPPGKSRKDFKNKIFKDTQDELDKYWDDVQIIAHALYKRKKLNFKDVKKILINKSKNKDFWKEKLKNIDLIFKSNSLLSSKDFKTFIVK
mgnify:FL=1